MRSWIFLFVLSMFFSFPLNAQQWQPDAGLIPPYAAKVTVSSGQNAAFITDGNPLTFWQSGNPLPGNYISRTDLNYFLNSRHFTLQPAFPAKNPAFDGNTNTSLNIPGGRLNIRLKPAALLLLLSLKANVKDTLYLILQTASHQFFRFRYTPTENFQLKNFKPETKVKITSVRLCGSNPKHLFSFSNWGLCTGCPLNMSFSITGKSGTSAGSAADS